MQRAAKEDANTPTYLQVPLHVKPGLSSSSSAPFFSSLIAFLFKNTDVCDASWSVENRSLNRDQGGKLPPVQVEGETHSLTDVPQKGKHVCESVNTAGVDPTLGGSLRDPSADGRKIPFKIRSFETW